MDLIGQTFNTSCVDGYEGVWYSNAIEVLANNKVHPIIFAAAVRELLTLGRGKNRNVLIVGPSNCGKTFLLKPLEVIFKVFSNTASDKYAWVGVEDSEIILLNDFRWSSEIIEWKSFLLLLEGDTVRFPAPKNQFNRDIILEKDIPILATSKCEITYRGKFNSEDKIEDEMMRSRWKVFQFFYQIPMDEQKNTPPCKKCFVDLIMLGNLG